MRFTKITPVFILSLSVLAACEGLENRERDVAAHNAGGPMGVLSNLWARAQGASSKGPKPDPNNDPKNPKPDNSKPTNQPAPPKSTAPPPKPISEVPVPKSTAPPTKPSSVQGSSVASSAIPTKASSSLVKVSSAISSAVQTTVASSTAKSIAASSKVESASSKSPGSTSISPSSAAQSTATSSKVESATSKSPGSTSISPSSASISFSATSKSPDVPSTATKTGNGGKPTTVPQQPGSPNFIIPGLPEINPVIPITIPINPDLVNPVPGLSSIDTLIPSATESIAIPSTTPATPDQPTQTTSPDPYTSSKTQPEFPIQTNTEEPTEEPEIPGGPEIPSDPSSTGVDTLIPTSTPAPTTRVPEMPVPTTLKTIVRSSTAPAPTTGPAGVAETYTVRPKDTLSSVAAKLNIPVEVLEKANVGVDADMLMPGQILNLPGDSPDAPVSAI